MFKLFIVTLCSFSCCFAAVVTNPTTQESEVVSRLKEFTNNLNEGKTQNLSSYWTQDAQVVNPITGQIVNGREEIGDYFHKKADEFKGRSIQFTVSNIEFQNGDSATVQGVVQFFQDGKLVDRQAREVDLVKQDGTWYLDFFHEIPVDLPPSAYEHLKDLEWLVGSWYDQDEHVSIDFNTRFDKHKNFLIQSFKMSVYGLEAMEGMQIIGWDPIAKELRSWVYDSDGGFGTGVWTKIEGGWSAKLNYTLSNGTTASSTNLYTKIGSKSYTYASTDRRIGNTELPNIEPVTVMKEE